MAARTERSNALELAREMAAAPLLAGLPNAAVKGFAADGTIRRYRRGTYLFHQGDPSDHVFFLRRGRIEISSYSATGHRQLLTNLEPPQFFGELGVLADRPRTAAALALEDCTVWAVSGDRFLRLLAEHFPATRFLLRSMAGQIHSHEAFVEDLLFLDLKGRVAKRLLQFFSPSLDDLPADGAILPSAPTHSDLASLCGGSRENVTRILSEFAKRGLVERSGRRYVLKNVAGLSRIAGV